MEHSKPNVRRCAIYTRKSSEEGLEQDFNSLHAQREACEAFIKSQASEGWKLIRTAYDDGGLSGGTMERPALQHLLADIGEGFIDVVVVYKVDRLTRSLADFAKMVELFDAHGVSFVAVTQQFNTTRSMGRLTLNVLLSFAQFEREVTGERIRDKIAASKKKGMWMGGVPPLGYDIRERRLVINPAEAKTVRHVYERYLELGCVRQLSQELCTSCWPTRSTSVRSAIGRSAIRDSTRRYFHENSGRECSSGSMRMRRGDGEPRTGRLPVRFRESCSMQMVSRCTCREQPRVDGDTATTSPKAWLMGLPATTERAGVFRRRSLSGRYRLRRGMF